LIEKPLESIRFEATSEHVEPLGDDAFFVSVSLVMQKLRAQASLLGQSDVPVLIVGEAGSGKFTVANLIHQLSVRSGFRLLRLDCAEMPEAILEAELFGDAASSGITRRDKGTIYLDEITAMPARLQLRLLQLLENQRPQSTDFRRTAGAAPTEVRILASSSADLERALEEKTLREDLYYRLSAFTVNVPPLRQRKDDIGTLLPYLMHKLARRYNLPPREFPSTVLETCRRYPWPGNLKELDSFVRRYLVAGDEQLPAGELDFNYGSGQDLSQSQNHNQNDDYESTVAAAAYRSPALAEAGAAQPESLKSMIQGIKSEAEQSAIAAALKKTGWNRKAAARLLRVSYRTLLYKIEQYNMRAALPVGELSLVASDNKRNGKAS
jgi:two-component system, NtrC family, response regulator AtoC